MMMIRGLAGIIIGIAYGFLVGVVVFLLTRIGLDEEAKANAGLIMLDPVAMAWFGTVISALIAGVCAALVGLVVGMADLGKGKAAIIGFLTGLSILVLLSVGFSAHLPNSLQELIDLLVAIAILPIGLALTGMVVAIVAERLTRMRSSSREKEGFVWLRF